MKTQSDYCSHIKEVLKKAFSTEDELVIVEASGYGGKIHVKVVSPAFEGKAEREKQSHLWDVIDSSDLTEEEKNAISLILPFTPSEL
ncbi:MAG: hypothetical protein ACLFUS_16575 [Candidatus Sumerlaeia bacterium]